MPSMGKIWLLLFESDVEHVGNLGKYPNFSYTDYNLSISLKCTFNYKLPVNISSVENVIAREKDFSVSKHKQLPNDSMQYFYL